METDPHGSGRDRYLWAALLDRLWQAQCRMERSYARAQRELERLQKARREPADDHVESRPLEATETSIVSPAPAPFPELPGRTLTCQFANGAVSDQDATVSEFAES